MQRDIFAAGTAPGSPNTENEVKTLVCYLLAETGISLTFAQLHEALREYQLVNYFELVSTVDSLVETGHLLRAEQEVPTYTVTDVGVSTAKTLDTSLPLTVREKAVKAVHLLLDRQARLEEVRTHIHRLDDGGYRLTLSIPEENTDLVSFSLYAPSKEEAEKLERNFLNDPVFIYQAVMSLLSGDLSVLGDLRPTTHPLF